MLKLLIQSILNKFKPIEPVVQEVTEPKKPAVKRVVVKKPAIKKVAVKKKQLKRLNNMTNENYPGCVVIGT